MRGGYGLSQQAAVLVLGALAVGALVGVVAGGSIADRSLRRGLATGRIVISGIRHIVAAALFLPGLLIPALPIAMIFYVLASAAFAARTAPLDAARLDVMHHRLWGRAEAVRTVLRRLMVAAAPVTFGVVADHVATGHTVPGASGFGATVSATGVMRAFLILLVSWPPAAG
jgi:hypothetical protein